MKAITRAAVRNCSRLQHARFLSTEHANIPNEGSATELQAINLVQSRHKKQRLVDQNSTHLCTGRSLKRACLSQKRFYSQAQLQEVRVDNANEPLTEQEVYDLQATWGQTIKDISAVYLSGGDFVARANSAAAELYAYGSEDILFKPTKAAEYPFRPTATSALSYFVGGSNVADGYAEDGGFAHNGGKGWSEVEFENVQVDLALNMAFAMGHYNFTQATAEGAGTKTRVEFTFGYKRDATGKPKIFLHHSSVPFSDAAPGAPVSATPIATDYLSHADSPITEAEIASLQSQWGQGIKDISAAYLSGGDFIAVANNVAAALYGYGHSNVLFKPTKAAELPFRPTGASALSYFVGGNNVDGGLSEDGGFAHNGGLGWSDVRFENVRNSLHGPVAISMGQYYFTQATGKGAGSETKVEFTFGYKRDRSGVPRIFIHHSSKPYGS